MSITCEMEKNNDIKPWAILNRFFDPLGRPHMASSDHYIHMCGPSVHSHFSKSRKTRQVSSMIHSVRPSLASSEHYFHLKFVLFWKVGTNGHTDQQTDDMCKNNDTTRQESSMIHSASPQSRPAVIVAWFWSFGTDVRTYGQMDRRTLCVKIVITTGRDCGRPRGSISCDCGVAKWINKTNLHCRPATCVFPRV